MSHRRQYIENCISRILSAECHPRKSGRRTSDIAQAIELAAKSGEEAAHEYLIAILHKAEKGAYTIPAAAERKP